LPTEKVKKPIMKQIYLTKIKTILLLTFFALSGLTNATSTGSAYLSVPTPSNVYIGDVTISTQTQMNAFFNGTNSSRWTKVDGDLTITGNSLSDPITDLSNLSNLTEVTGTFLIQQFTRSSNPSDLGQLAALNKAGRLTIITCPSLQTISLPGITTVDGALIIRNNRFAKTISLPNLASVGGGQLMISRNHRAELIEFSQNANSFTLTNVPQLSNVDIHNNGDSTSNPLTMNFNKITSVGKNFTFSNNSNSAVNNFDNIFSSLTSVGGDMVITNNTSVATCCIAANATVTGSRTISGNTGNCANITAVLSNCGTLSTPSCVGPTIPTLSTSNSTICRGQTTILDIATGSLNSAIDWHWYEGSCGGIPINSGNSINVSPTVTTTYYARGEGGCTTSGNCAQVTITVIQPTTPSAPTLSSTISSFCGIQSPTLSISSGSLGDATHWQWYSGSCGGTPVGTGTSILVSPTATTTYYARGEGGCTTPGTCGSVTITVTGPGTPSGANVFTGDLTISTQTQMNAFFNSSNGNKWTKVTGNLTINGNSATDPITSFCNLSSLTEVDGILTIQQFTQSGNPTELSQLAPLKKAGRLTIITNPSFESISLPGLTDVVGTLIIRNNRFAKNILAENLASVGGGQFMIVRNHRAENIRFSNNASSFTLTNFPQPSNVDIQSNGDSTTNALTMDFKKITSVAQNFIFNNNKNSGVNNFDNIFTGLSSIGGNLTITNNTSVAKCCIALATSVGGSRTVSGNTGNCADLTAVSADCSRQRKRSGSQAITTKQIREGISFKLFPNPNSGQFELEVFTEESGPISISVTDLMGRTVLTQTETVNSNQSIALDMRTATVGQYILKAEMNGQVFVKKVVLVK